MRKKLLIRAGLGFLFGIVMVVLIPAVFNRAPDGTISLCSLQLVSRVGSETAAMLFSLLMYGLYGACCMGGTMLYEIERWPLALATAVHYLIVALGYALCAWLLCWNLRMKELLFIEGMMTLGFFLIWLFLYLRFRAEVRELNELTERRKNRDRVR